MKLRLWVAVALSALASTPAAAVGRDLTVCAATVGGFCIDTSVNLSILVPFLIFAFGHFINEWMKSREIAAGRVKLYKALFVEVRLNLKGLKAAHLELPSPDKFSEFLRENKNNRPVLVYHFTEDVYKANVANLAGLPSSLIEGIVTFYQSLAYIRSIADAVNLPSYTTISDKGREGVIEKFREEMRIAVAQGEGAERQLDQILDGHTRRIGG